MIKVERPIPEDASWQKLRLKAEQARKKAIADFEANNDVKIDEELYKKYMPFLLKLFNGKCAYCETKLTSNQPGDVEHFRPKGRVVDDSFKPVRVNIDGKGEMAHPGYYWLAYEWHNLLPSCIDCNRFRYHGGQVTDGSGKADRFPLEIDGDRACCEGQEKLEKPLYIDPTKVDPDAHLEFFPNGLVTSRTPIGEKTIEDFGLIKREGLVAARATAFDDASELVLAYVAAAAARNRDRMLKLGKRIVNDWQGIEPYTAMQRFAIETVRKELSSEGIDLKLPLIS